MKGARVWYIGERNAAARTAIRESAEQAITDAVYVTIGSNGTDSPEVRERVVEHLTKARNHLNDLIAEIGGAA